MDLATLAGILFSGVLVISAILLGGSGAWFISAPSMMIVVGGTMGATLLSYPLSQVLGVFKIVMNVFFHRSQAADKVINMMMDFGKLARKEGILSFESKLKDIDDPFFVKGLELAIDGVESQSIRNVLTTEISYVEERHALGAEIFTSMGAYAPAVGMLGTIIGLVQMLMQMEDPSSIGAPMAVALLTTFYGTLLANLLFLPIAAKLKTRSKEEIFLKELVLEGIMSIQSGDNHRVIEQKLKAFLPRSKKISTGEETEEQEGE
ncbi:MAG: MotA/TolQ/ExbB proton channel family protein [Deltaproteobacteria bacterium]|nr:MotA/TolQ/ExbB proton channel family protein [Deltaproteobacteria bacterium]